MKAPVTGPSPAYDEKLTVYPVTSLGILKLSYEHVNWRLVIAR